MKKSLLALAVLGAFAGAAQAQSSVTLYGIIDEGLTYTNNQAGHSNFQMASGVLQGSRWGLRGAEDLGGGLKAIFTLENGFDINSGKLGQGGREFGRQAYVGLSSATAGTVTMGRQYDSVVDYLGPLASNAQWAGYIGAHPFDNDNTNNTFRINNSIKYTSANYSGFSFSGMYGFSNQANSGGGTGFANNREWSFGAGYSNGPLNVAAAYLQINNPGTTLGNTSGAATDDWGGGYFTSATKQQVWGVGGNYAFGPATVGLLYTHTKYDNPTLGASLGGGDLSSLKFDNIEVNGKYMLTPALQLGASYTYTWGKAEDVGAQSKPRYHTIDLGADYWLSKRTDLYLIGVFQKAAGDAQIAAINGLTPSDTDKQVAVRLGLRHKF